MLATYLHILLFTYAAVNKILDYDNFSAQLGQSPLLSAFAGIIAPAVPAVEIGISALLMLPASRVLGLYLSFALTVMFTAYIFIILTYSSFVPCSCGGILEDMTWTQHLFFNLGFVLLSALALLLALKPVRHDS
ncbi:MAG: hypothetical protein EOP49_42780 [Sphingobacteriales bacterium]|nr:MAG: hypothetical protein EOP49_42780 [Sphingobacteriales bacterium]